MEAVIRKVRELIPTRGKLLPEAFAFFSAMDPGLRSFLKIA
jgi:hypothetical protein